MAQVLIHHTLVKTVTFAIDGTVATDNNSLTLQNKTLLLPTIDEIDTVASSDFTIDSVQDIILDADGADIIFKDDGTEFGRITNDSTDLILKSAVSDKDFKIKGNDGGSEITAVTFDMSELWGPQHLMQELQQQQEHLVVQFQALNYQSMKISYLKVQLQMILKQH